MSPAGGIVRIDGLKSTRSPMLSVASTYSFRPWVSFEVASFRRTLPTARQDRPVPFRYLESSAKLEKPGLPVVFEFEHRSVDKA